MMLPLQPGLLFLFSEPRDRLVRRADSLDQLAPPELLVSRLRDRQDRELQPVRLDQVALLLAPPAPQASQGRKARRL